MTQSAESIHTAPLPMDCLLRHGLEQQPFDAVAGDTFLYTDPALDMPLGVLLDHLHKDDNLLVFKGDLGAGKSTQLLRLLSRSAETLDFCAFKARPGTSFAAIDYTIRQFWGERTDSDEETPLAELLCAIAQGSKRPVLVIDDAHHIESGALAELLKLRRQTHTLCDHAPGILLVGEPRLELLLEQANAGDQPSEAHISVQLRPLTREQTEAYLRHRLQVAGADNPDMLSGEQAQAIHLESGGLPLSINAAANRALLQLGATGTAGAGPMAQTAATPPWKQRWFVPAVAAVVLVGMVITVINILGSDGDDALETRELLVLPEPRPLVTPPPPPALPEPPIEEPAPMAEPEPESVPPPVAEATPEAPASAPLQPAPQTPPSSPPAAPAPPPAAPAPAVPAPAVPAPAPVAPAPAPRPTGLLDATWLREQPAGRYTIQVLGLSELQALRNYARDQALQGDVAWFRTQRNGADWYVLVVGSYPDADAARAAIATLPAEVRRNQPWVRTFGSIQQAMSQAR